MVSSMEVSSLLVICVITNIRTTKSYTCEQKCFKTTVITIGLHKVLYGSATVDIIVACKRVKIDEKLLGRAYRNLPTLFRTVPSPTPTASSSPRLRFATPTQNCNRYNLNKKLSYRRETARQLHHGPHGYTRLSRITH